MAKATLELVIVDNGQSPVGMPAPAGSGGGSQPPVGGAAAAATNPDDYGPSIVEAINAMVARDQAAHDATMAALNAVTSAISIPATPQPAGTSIPQQQPTTPTAAPPQSGQTSAVSTPQIPPSGTTTTSTPQSTATGSSGARAPRQSQPTGTAGKVESASSTVGKVASVSGSAGAGVASAAGTVEGLAALSAELGPAAVAIAGVALAAGGAAYAFKKTTDMLSADAESLGNFSPELAQANAEASLAQMLAELRRANELGADLAKYQETTSRISVLLYELWTKIEGWLLEYVQPVLNLILAAIEAIFKWLKLKLPAAPAPGIDPFIAPILAGLAPAGF